MKKIYFTVGPSQIYPTIPKHLNNALKENILSLNHRGTEFKSLFDKTSKELRKLLKIPTSYHIFFVSSALECMERSIQGCVQNCSLHIITGAFGKAWVNYASQLGKTILQQEAKLGEGLDLARLHIPKQTELVCITQNDTSTGVWLSMENIYNLKKKYPEKLFAIDVVSSIPYIDIDFSYVDITFFSVQKGFGLPAGLAIMIVNPQALAKAEALSKRGINIGSYHSLKNLADKAAQFQTPETPNVLDIYLLNKVLKDLLKIGIKKIRKDTNLKAKYLYDFFDSHNNYQPFIKNPTFRSPTTLVIDVGDQSEKIRRNLSKKGFIIGAGYGDNRLKHIRIANFPSHRLKDIKQMLKYI